MGTLVIFFYRPHAGHENEARMRMAGHVPLLRDYGMITYRPVIQGVS